MLIALLRRVQRADGLAGLAIRVATDIPDDAEAVAAVKAAGGRLRTYKHAAALIRRDGYRYEHRNGRRAARLLEAAADGGLPVTASSEEEEALFRAVDDLEARPAEDGFAVLAAEVPALRELEQQVIASRSAPGWEDRDADDRVREILGALDRFVGPSVLAGSPLVRSAAAHRRARIHLLGTVGLLLEDREAGPEEQAELLAALARGYGVEPDFKSVAGAIRKRVGDRDGRPTMTVLSELLWERGMGERLRRGDGPSDSSRKATANLRASYGRRLPADFVDRVIDEVRSTLLRASGHTGDQ